MLCGSIAYAAIKPHKSFISYYEAIVNVGCCTFMKLHEISPK